ncbi:MAG: membrane protein insertase YidC [Lachnospiraceae bacterium]|nr:membrane protein insertase YidC [Lachnospiraceae bacterium]
MEILAQLFGILINGIYGLTKDYGVAIVMITIAIRACLVPLNIRQRQQMKKQQQTSKEVEALKAKYGKNQEKLNQELQKVYRKNGTGMGSCLLSFIQLPIMYGLYKAIQLVTLAGTTTVLLPWVTSILVKDQMLILPIATILVQILPQTYPYLRFFKDLKLQKAPAATIFILLLTNSFFVFVIPSGIGLYYFVSGLFVALEQFIVNIIEARKMKIASAA